ncbi:Protein DETOXIFICATION 47 [Mactra antiquata]
MGYDDLVRCFSCDGGLRRWEPDDNPWIEHCRWFPTCPYAIEVKGEQFIAMVLAASHDVNEDTGAASGQTTNPAMNVLTAKSPVVQAILDEHRATIVEMMGFDENDFEEAVLELKKRDATTSVVDILEIIEINKDRKAKEEEYKILKEENPYELNRRLKNFLICCVCDKNEANALFLPCAHHNTCVKCSEAITTCPSCNRPVKQTIKTYMG